MHGVYLSLVIFHWGFTNDCCLSLDQIGGEYVIPDLNSQTGSPWQSRILFDWESNNTCTLRFQEFLLPYLTSSCDHPERGSQIRPQSDINRFTASQPRRHKNWDLLPWYVASLDGTTHTPSKELINFSLNFNPWQLYTGQGSDLLGIALGDMNDFCAPWTVDHRYVCLLAMSCKTILAHHELLYGNWTISPH